MANLSGLTPIFAARLSAVIAAAEKATGQKAEFSSGVRSRGEQAVLYQRYKNSGFQRQYIAAPPGSSAHERKEAVDIKNKAIRDWVQLHATEYGLEAGTRRGRARQAKGLNWTDDGPHIQLARGVLKTPYDGTPNAYAAGDPRRGLPPAQQAAADVAAGLPPSAPGGPPTLRKGDTDARTGGAVTRLQQQLAASGFDVGAVDGNYGRRTAAAVRAVTAKYGLTKNQPDVAGPQVQAALERNAPRDVALPRLRPDPAGPGAGLSAGAVPIRGLLSGMGAPPPTGIGRSEPIGAAPKGDLAARPYDSGSLYPGRTQADVITGPIDPFTQAALNAPQYDLSGSVTAGGGVPGATATMPLVAARPQNPGGYPAAWGVQSPPATLAGGGEMRAGYPPTDARLSATVRPQNPGGYPPAAWGAQLPSVAPGGPGGPPSTFPARPLPPAPDLTRASRGLANSEDNMWDAFKGNPALATAYQRGLGGGNAATDPKSVPSDSPYSDAGAGGRYTQDWGQNAGVPSIGSLGSILNNFGGFGTGGSEPATAKPIPPAVPAGGFADSDRFEPGAGLSAPAYSMPQQQGSIGSGFLQHASGYGTPPSGGLQGARYASLGGGVPATSEPIDTAASYRMNGGGFSAEAPWKSPSAGPGLSPAVDPQPIMSKGVGGGTGVPAGAAPTWGNVGMVPAAPLPGPRGQLVYGGGPPQAPGSLPPSAATYGRYGMAGQRALGLSDVRPNQPRGAGLGGFGVGLAASALGGPPLGLLAQFISNAVSRGTLDSAQPYRGPIQGGGRGYAPATQTPWGTQQYYSDTGHNLGNSPYTPAGAGWQAPSFDTKSGGPSYAYNSQTQQYVDSQGRVHSY